MLDPYACAVYIVTHITKGQRRMSKLLRKACEEAKAGNKNIVNKVRHIGNKFLNAVEISAKSCLLSSPDAFEKILSRIPIYQYI